MTPPESRRASRPVGDDRLNEEFNTVLRKAAEKREVRARVQSSGDALAASQESAELLGLARRRVTRLS